MVTDKRIMPMSDNIDKMYEQQLINGPVSKEYVVRERKYHVNTEVKPVY